MVEGAAVLAETGERGLVLALLEVIGESKVKVRITKVTMGASVVRLFTRTEMT